MGGTGSGHRKWIASTHDEIIRQLRKDGTSIRGIAKAMGFSPPTIVTKLKLLGLSNPDSKGRPRGPDLRLIGRDQAIIKSINDGMNVKSASAKYDLTPSRISQIIKTNKV